jgi:hypothetical protein
MSSRVGLLDVDTWPVFVRFTQNTGIQDEVAERLRAIYEQAGFHFVYYDGAEDVHLASGHGRNRLFDACAAFDVARRH